MVSIKTEDRSIDYMGNCSAETTGYFFGSILDFKIGRQKRQLRIYQTLLGIRILIRKSYTVREVHFPYIRVKYLRSTKFPSVFQTNEFGIKFCSIHLFLHAEEFSLIWAACSPGHFLKVKKVPSRSKRFTLLWVSICRFQLFVPKMG